MFIAIVIPEVRASSKTALLVLVSAVLSVTFFYTPYLKAIPSGFTVIIISVAVSAVFALLCPIKEVEENAVA